MQASVHLFMSHHWNDKMSLVLFNMMFQPQILLIKQSIGYSAIENTQHVCATCYIVFTTMM